MPFCAKGSRAAVLNYIHELYAQAPALAIAAFCAAHLAASISGFPGGCTALNILAGAMMGLLPACAVIYPVTMLSALLVYAGGARFRNQPWATRAAAKTKDLMAKLRSADFGFMVVLRLSPLLPFSVINLACGVLRVPLPLFLGSTFVGIFFDVVLLASLGASLTAGPWIVAAFAALLIAAQVIRSRAGRAVAQGGLR